MKGKTGWRSSKKAFDALMSRLIYYSQDLGWRLEGVVLGIILKILEDSGLWRGQKQLLYGHTRQRYLVRFFEKVYRDMGGLGRPDKSRGRLKMLSTLYAGDTFRSQDVGIEWGVSEGRGRAIICQARALGYVELVSKGVYRFTDLEIEDHHNPSRVAPLPVVEEVDIEPETAPNDEVQWNDNTLRVKPILSNRAVDTMIDDDVYPMHGPQHLMVPIIEAFKRGRRRWEVRRRKEWRPWLDFKKTIPKAIVRKVDSLIRAWYAFELSDRDTPQGHIDLARQLLAQKPTL